MVIKLAIGIVLAAATYWVGTHPEARVFAKADVVPVISTEKMTIDTTLPPKAHTEPLTASDVPVTEVKPARDTDVPTKKEEPAPQPAPVPVKSSSLDNQTIIWNRLRAEGYTREQTAGIMGNLQQEHNFKTDDHPNGLGIAQWMDGRRAALMARGDYLNINVQLDHLIHELNTTEAAAKAEIVASGLEGATAAFQNKFERCNPAYCHLNQRLQYAYAILERY